MLFRRDVLDRLRDGSITLAFRRWTRPTVKAGGSLQTGAGLLHIGAVDAVSADDISDGDARRAGYADREAVIAELNARTEGRIYRIELGALEPDPRIGLRRTRASGSEIQALIARLERLDVRAAGGPWTRRVLEIIERHPAVRAADLCRKAGQDKDSFKTNVRKLKNLGLTESLEVGYRLSPRGKALLESLRK